MKLISEYGEKRRTPIVYDQIPPLFIKAILSAEDDRFYQHGGVDLTSLLRAVGQLVKSGRIQTGGSTITMQVARNYFLSHKQTFTRKFNEILLALHIERALSKNEILELYVNKIFLGNRAYGIEAAARVYYGKGINELDLSQLAMIAGLPKAPSTYNPLVNPERATIRRNWIIERMYKLGYIDQEAFHASTNKPISASYHGPIVDLPAPYAAEMARQFILEKFGNSAYEDGYTIITTLESALQNAAEKAVIDGTIAYDERHGFRGPEHHHDITYLNQGELLTILQKERTIGGLVPALVLEATQDSIQLLSQDNGIITLDWVSQKKALRPYISEDTLGPTPPEPTTYFSPGDITRLKKIADDSWQITQLPKNQAALVALRPKDGAIIALVGGFDFYASKYNRITQANRQPGSNFKPFIYATALEHGYTAASLVNDAPIVFDDDKLESSWRPENSSGKFYGPTRLREALYRSRNLVSIRLLKALGVNNAINGIERFGFSRENLPKDLSLALGSHAVKPMDIARGYAAFANGGFLIDPYLVKEIRDNNNNPVFSANPVTACAECDQSVASLATGISNPAQRIIEPRIAYILDSILRDVIQKGTARKARVLGRRDIAGKTGTTNGPTDAWFSGYNPEIVATTWLGFDQNLNLGKREYGGSAALPIWIDFMKEALKDKPETLAVQPEGMITVRINPETGKRTLPGESNAIFEIFREEHAPEELKESNLPNTGGKTNSPTELF